MTKSLSLYALILLTLFLTLTAAAQPKGSKTPSKAAQTAQAAREKAMREKDEATVEAMSDPGFDAAVVIKDSQVRATPKPTGKIVFAVKRTDFLSLADREPEGNWYKVINFDTGDEGWIDGKNVVIKLTGMTNTGPPMREEAATAATAAPEVVITNLEEKTTLRLKVNGELHLIAPKATKILQIPGGKFTYFGWSPGIRPTSGNRTLENGRRYIWTFRINRR